MADTRFLLVGLGNPGPDYHLTRHNVGFLFLDHLASVNGWRIDSLKMQGLFGQGRHRSSQLFLVKPQTYMNRSGECVRRFLDYFKVPLANLLVLHDDIDLAAGRIRMVRRGGAGGHNGIRSLIQHLGTQDFARMKIGIGRPVADAAGHAPAVERFVLARMSEEEQRLLHERAGLVEEAVTLFVEQGIDVCMNRINGR
jgi:PTH1 family peptidyl-tRNA hydrolase